MEPEISNHSCRFCGASLELSFVDLGRTPLANSFLSAARLTQPEPKYPLHARVCGTCRLVQVEAVATPSEIFGHYAYFSSFAASWVEHARRFVTMAVKRWSLGTDSHVVEVASNDGYLLRHFVEAGIKVLGIEPAANVAEAARKVGVPTLVEFFGIDSARRLRDKGQGADLIVCNNVLAHVPEIRDFVGGIAILLKPDGVVSIEFPHLLRLIEQVQFDTIYHEHFSYLSLLAVERIFAGSQLRVFDVEELPTHGGSLRVLACHADSAAHPPGDGLSRVRLDEAKAGLDTDLAYAHFESRVQAVRDALVSFLDRSRAEKKNRRRLWRGGQGQHAVELLRHRARADRLCGRQKPAQTGTVSAWQSSSHFRA